MAFTRLNEDLQIISALADKPNTTGGLSAAELKAKFDEAAGKIKTFLNSTLLSELEATGAAAKIGISAISGVAGATVQAALSSLKTLIDGKAAATHAARHASTGADPVSPAAIGAATASALTSHTGNTSNPHNVTRAQLGVTQAGKVKVGSSEYTLRTGTAGAGGYITFVLE